MGAACWGGTAGAEAVCWGGAPAGSAACRAAPSVCPGVWAAAAAAGIGAGAPQRAQNRAPSFSSLPHRVQNMVGLLSGSDCLHP